MSVPCVLASGLPEPAPAYDLRRLSGSVGGMGVTHDADDCVRIEPALVWTPPLQGHDRRAAILRRPHAIEPLYRRFQ
jgi:hypothetical protein